MQSFEEQPSAIVFEAEAPEIPALPPRTLYRVGTNDDCPFQNVDVMGISFPRFTEQVQSVPGTTMTQRFRIRGGLAWLADDQIPALKDAVANRVLRFTANGNTAKMLLRTAEAYRPSPYDKPLGPYLYMVPVPGQEGEAVSPEQMYTPPEIAEAMQASMEAEKQVKDDTRDQMRRKIHGAAKMFDQTLHDDSEYYEDEEEEEEANEE